MPSNSALLPGNHRPIYLWAGPGTIRMNRLKFMDAAVDEGVHLDAHTAAGVQRVVDETGCSWVYLTYNWGFPPEQEAEDWDSFARAAADYQAAGAKVFAYIQTSNCVYAGSFVGQDWYARDVLGRRIHYYTGRYMTCWQHPDWIAQLERMVAGAIARGADGVFFDNPWYAAQPVSMFGSWHGSAGCYCASCRDKYLRESGQQIPTAIRPGDALSDAYIRWRANQVTLILTHFSGYTKNILPNIPISINNFDAVMRPSYLIYGIDLKALAGLQDIMMIEDYGLPRYDTGPQPRLANNALTIHTARALVADTPISVDPYERGIGFDEVFPARRYQQGLAEAAACGASMVIKGTEFVDRGTFTLLTAPQYRETRTAIGRYHTWLAEHAEHFQSTRNLAQAALLYPGDRLWQDWDHLAPLFFGAGQTLLAAGIPWRVVTRSEELPSNLRTLLVFEDSVNAPADHANLSVISVPDLPAWSAVKPNRLTSSRILAGAAGRVIDWGYHAYFSSRTARKIMDRAGVMRLFTGSPLFNLPTPQQQSALKAALPAGLFPRVHAHAPVLVENWERNGSHELHLVNYAPQRQSIRVDFAHAQPRQVVSPDHPTFLLPETSSVELDLDIYSIIVSPT